MEINVDLPVDVYSCWCLPNFYHDMLHSLIQAKKLINAFIYLSIHRMNALHCMHSIPIIFTSLNLCWDPTPSSG